MGAFRAHRVVSDLSMMRTNLQVLVHRFYSILILIASNDWRWLLHTHVLVLAFSLDEFDEAVDIEDIVSKRYVQILHN